MLFSRCLTLLATSIAAANALSVRYCSNENTGTGFNTGDFVYNTLGSCSTKCQNSSFGYAIVQGQGCWCSNDKPTNQQSPAGCNQACPGYPTQKCGNTEEGLFGYVEVQHSGPCSNSSTGLASMTATATVNMSSSATSTSGAQITSSTVSATPAVYTGTADRITARGVGNIVFGAVLGGAVFALGV